MISKETIAEVKDLPLYEIISQDVQLKKNGSNYTGLCPFHNEKTPSFHVKADDNFYHCFGCGVSGNPISYIMETQSLSFPEAVEYLANQFNIEIKYTKINSRQSQPLQDLYKVNAVAYEYFSDQLKSASPEIKNYIVSRGINKELYLEFGIAFAPDSWDGLFHFLQSRGISPEVCLLSGLVKRGEQGKYYDTFRNRMIFPIWIDRKRIAGFAGRIVSEDPEKKMAKYLNSPETAVYKKNKILYGFPHAQSDIKQEQQVYIVEGYLDLIALHKVGIKNVLATCGTALTEGHISRINRVAREVLLMFDGDTAGKKAAAKVFENLPKFEIDVNVIFLPDQNDPDDFARTHGEQTVEQLGKLEKKSLISCYLDQELQNLSCHSVSQLGAVAKEKLAVKTLNVISQVSNPILKSELINYLAFFLGLNQAVIQQLLNNFRESGKAVLNHVPNNLLEDADSHSVAEELTLKALDSFNLKVLQLAIVDYKDIYQQLEKNQIFATAVVPEVHDFISKLQSIRSNFPREKFTAEEIKQEIQNLLKSYPSDIKSFWVQSFQLKEKEFNFAKMYEESLAFLEAHSIASKIKHLQQLLDSTQLPEEKARLMQQILTLRRVS